MKDKTKIVTTEAYDVIETQKQEIAKLKEEIVNEKIIKEEIVEQYKDIEKALELMAKDLRFNCVVYPTCDKCDKMKYCSSSIDLKVNHYKEQAHKGGLNERER